MKLSSIIKDSYPVQTINKILYQEVKPYRWRVVLILAIVFMGVGFEAITPIPFKILIDNVLGSEVLDPATFIGKYLSFLPSKEGLGFFIVMIYAVSSMLSTMSDYFVGVEIKKLAKEVIKSFSKKAFENLEKLAIGHYRNQKIGDYIYRLSYDVSALGGMLESGVIPLITNFFYIVATLTIMLIISKKLTLIALAIMPLLAIGLKVFNVQINKAAKKSEHSNSLLFSFIEEVLNQLKIVQAFNQEEKASKAFNHSEEVALTDELNMYVLSFLLNLAIGIIIAIGYSVLIAYGIRSVILGELSTGLLVVFIFYIDNLTNPLLSLLSAVTTLKEDYIKVSRMVEFFTPKFHVVDQGILEEIANDYIAFEGVSVYGQEGGVILKNISFRIPVGKKTVIVGVSGSGKTTIASLILRFMNPTEGEIKIGDSDITEYAVKNLRSAISYVPQEIILFNDTIKNNIVFGNPGASDNQIKQAVRLAEADKFINQLPGKLDFHVGTNGINLSGGQRQRVLLARAFLRSSAKIVIFDEPVSSLDIKTRGQILDNIEEFSKGKTTIIISNILELIDRADYVILINEGQILHAGSGSSLKKESSLSKLIINTT